MMDLKKPFLFVLPQEPDFMPYIYNYFKIANDMGVESEVICWNRRGGTIQLPKNYIVYNHPTKIDYSAFKKLKELFGFYRFVRRRTRGKEYRAVFTFTIADSILLTMWLTRDYKGRFVFDIRDYSPMMAFAPTRWLTGIMLRNSALNVISSPGFFDWLPKGYKYVICHNINLDQLNVSTRTHVKHPQNKDVNILTIGSLRDFESNQAVLARLGNKKDIFLHFVGEGIAAAPLKEYCNKENLSNVSFLGRYEKKDEGQLVQQCDMMNVVMPHNPVADHLMSNRFYLSIMFGKPMIVNEGCFQAEQVKKYGIGLVVSSSDDMYGRIMNYWSQLDWECYFHNCERCLKDIADDMTVFESKCRQVFTFQ